MRMTVLPYFTVLLEINQRKMSYMSQIDLQQINVVNCWKCAVGKYLTTAHLK